VLLASGSVWCVIISYAESQLNATSSAEAERQSPSHPKGAPAMHGLDHSTTFDRIVALDLGKFNSVACLYDPTRRQRRCTIC
jgi:hypothetical protein